MPPLDDSDSEEKHALGQKEEEKGNTVLLGRAIHGVCWVLQYRGTSLIRNRHSPQEARTPLQGYLAHKKHPPPRTLQ